MPRVTDPLIVQSFIQLERAATPDVAPTGKGRIYYSKSTGKAYLSLSGGAYSEIVTPLVSGLLANSVLATPKIVAYQQTVLFSQLTDSEGATGTLDLSTSIPAGAVYLRTLYTAITGFAGGASATAIVGDGTDHDRYNTGTPDVFTTAAAGVDAGAPSGTVFHSAAKTPRLTITEAADFGLITAGAITVTLFYYAP